MPTTYAHYRMGETVRKQLPESIQNIISGNEELFHFGVHGPDHFFYYNPLIKTDVGAIGTRVHEQPAKTFFTKAAHVIHKCSDKDARLAYVYGYLCHFAMDYVCHGYIGEQMEEKGLSHYEIEAEYDRRLLVMDGYERPAEVCVTKHMHPSMRNARIIAGFYEGVTAKQVYKSLRGMPFYLNILRAPDKKLRRLLFLAMKIAGIYKKMGGLVMNYEESPKCSETTDELVRRFDVAVEVAVPLLMEYERFYAQGGMLPDTFCYNFESGWCKENE